MSYKLNVTFTFDDETIESIQHAKEILANINGTVDNCQVSLTRSNDRSGANLLAPLGNGHFKHNKISLNDIDKII